MENKIIFRKQIMEGVVFQHMFRVGFVKKMNQSMFARNQFRLNLFYCLLRNCDSAKTFILNSFKFGLTVECPVLNSIFFQTCTVTAFVTVLDSHLRN